MALLSNAIILVTNLYSLQLFVEILVCLQHLQSGTRGLTDAVVLPQLQLTRLLIIPAIARQTIPLFWKADKMPSVSARLSKRILQCEETQLQIEERGGNAPHPYPITNHRCTYVCICTCVHVSIHVYILYNSQVFQLFYDVNIFNQKACLTYASSICNPCILHHLTLITS